MPRKRPTNRTGTGAGPQLFLSYRRNDSIEQTNRLEEALTREFPGVAVFIDRMAVAGGQDFEREIRQKLQTSLVVLVLIGPLWMGPLQDGNSRISQEGDTVRQEVELALQGLATGRHVMPVLVGGASMPAPDLLPSGLQALSRINALPLRSGDDQAGDLARILARIRAIVDDPLCPPVRLFLPRTFDGEDQRFRALNTSFHAAYQTLQALLATCSSQASALRHQAESTLACLPYWPGEHPAIALIARDEHTGRSHLDRVMDSPLGALGAVGNLTGLGHLRSLEGRNRQELDMALRLGSAFAATALALKPVATVGWVYYTSKQRFIHIYPWAHSRVVAFDKRLLTMDFYLRGTARANPQRAVFWTAPYEDHYGKGMMVTVGAPVYRGNSFLGTVAIDLGTDMLNDFVSSHRMARGPVFVVNAEGELIAAPGIARSSDTGKRLLRDALPPELTLLPSQLLFSRAGTWIVGRHVLLVAPIANTDWQLVHICERSTV